MTTRFAFVGFRHPHIFDMYQRCCERDDIEIVAGCEEDAATRDELAKSGAATITHYDFEAVLNDAEADVIAVGDCYGHRADIIEAALRSGKHVISDKPMCISLDELGRIEAASKESGKIVGCMLDMRNLAVYLGMRNLIQEGAIGEVHAIQFEGQHPLLYGKRPAWYFEEGMHGGVLNDIIVHAVDFVPWATGLRWKTVVAARCWNATVPQHPHFSQCGQAMLMLENDAGVICDVSYLTPDSFAYDFPLYWRVAVWGSNGVVEAGVNSTTVTLYRNGSKESEAVPLPAAQPGGYLDSYLAEIRGDTERVQLCSKEVFAAATTSLQIQAAADQSRTNVPLIR
ncbi:MAG: oxidoreductase [Planctomycetaceae bacterium]|nr:oxidoreductase [Planctomycetaceae bacterium]